MSLNRRRHANALPLLSMARWILMAVFFGMAGLGYVYFKNQLHTSGVEIKRLERELAELQTSCEVAQAKIASLSSRTELQRRLNTGFIKMQPITDERIVRVSGPGVPGLASAEPGELRPVVNARTDR